MAQNIVKELHAGLLKDILRKRFFPAAKCFQVVHDVIKSRSQ